MSQNLEIEFKNMLSPEEFIIMKNAFSMGDDMFFRQENHYFDTADFSLKDKGAALRIREKEGNYVLTLKQPAKKGLLESNQILLHREFTTALQSGKLPDGIIRKQIEEMDLSFTKFEFFGSLITDRAEIVYRNGLLVLDHSYYLNYDDYELEYEVEDYDLGRPVFLELLQRYSIPERKSKNKVQRFYEKKSELSK